MQEAIAGTGGARLRKCGRGPGGLGRRRRGRGACAVATLEMEGVTESLEIDEAVIADVVAGAPAERVLRYHTTSSSTIPEDAAVVVCRAAPALSCTDPIPLSGIAWLADVTFTNGAAVLFATKGTPPPDVIGTKPLVFR